MFRGTGARTALALLAAALLALQFLAPTGTFASAHTLGHAKAKAGPGITPSTQPARAGADTLREPRHPHRPVTTVPCLRDRQRGPASAGAPERAPISRQAAAPHPPGACGAPHEHATRPPGARTPAALQVLRC
ncbi:hypothetical protein QQY24_06950 [Streptomyces sp. TG1A-8]|uniref:hypothetical protein n=1 Tax=Streptomyces sp. TG1A-8 TaxID=3051385 RepID=UPI00265BB1F5|nr:hypothetical protein [Streptomyces sp. TG1A-8]MDO0925173.1 hypothetical protein [Streptomyces sp. TG1A-8]